MPTKVSNVQATAKSIEDVIRNDVARLPKRCQMRVERLLRGAGNPKKDVFGHHTAVGYEETLRDLVKLKSTLPVGEEDILFKIIRNLEKKRERDSGVAESGLRYVDARRGRVLSANLGDRLDKDDLSLLTTIKRISGQ
jgi:hypothetical protein